MGQRHQIYVRLPKKFYNKGNQNNREETTIGIHHQWLYGSTALRQLSNLLTFVKNQTEYSPLGDKGGVGEAMDALVAIYSVDIQHGYFHAVCPLWGDEEDGESKVGTPGDECSDPTKGDNNNGITVIDLSGKEPKYCFMSVGHLECLAEGQDENYTNFKPMSAEDYLLLHYPDYKTKKVCGCEYCLKDTKLKASHDKQTVETGKYYQKLIEFFADYKLVTNKDIERIFPALPSKSIRYIKE
jgi:hypothetical protein